MESAHNTAGTDEVERAEHIVQVQRELEGLPEELRLPLRLRFEGELTYAGIGAALGVAEPTAHDRVRKGLEALRRAVRGAGVLLVGLSLEEHLSAAPRLPVGLEARLLELPRSAALVGSGPLSLLPWVAGLALVGTLVWAAPELEPAGDLEAAAVSPSTLVVHDLPGPASADTQVQDGERRPAGALKPAAQEPPQTAPKVLGHVAGRVLNAEGFPVVGARVVALSTDRQGKLSDYGVEATTDHLGGFRLPVEVPGKRRHVTVQIHQLGYVAHHVPPTEVLPKSTSELGELRLELPAGQAEGEYELRVRLITPDGSPVPDARVNVDHLVPLDQAKSGSWATWYNSGRVLHQRDDGGNSTAGALTLRGARLGPKRVRVLPQGSAWAPKDVTATVSLGVNELVVLLTPARTLRGRVLTLDGAVPDHLSSHLRWSCDRNVWVDLELADDGSFTVGGLAPEPYSLHLQPRNHAPWSEVARQVAADEDFVEVVVKLARDPRAVGDHMAELHGTLRNMSGDPVVWHGIDVESWWFPGELDGDWEKDILPNHLSSPPVQRGAFFADGSSPYQPPPPSAEVHLTGLAPGRKVVYLSADGYSLDVAGPFELSDGELIAGLELVVRPAAALRVRVVDGAGRPVEGAGVFLTGVGPYSEARIAEHDQGNREISGRGFYHANRFRRTKAGTVTIDRLPVGRTLRVAVVHPDWEPVVSEVLDLEPGETSDLLLRVLRGR